jgi:geranylgeranyl pyrophosphate synthase
MASPSERARLFLAATAIEVGKEIDRLLPPEDERPATIHRAVRYAVFGGGKRLRPALALAAAGASGANADRLREILPAASALELIHTYSLVHDDLPALDDDDLRRGRKTTHVVFGEAMAILTGDALLTIGLEWLARHPEGDRFAVARGRVLAEVADAIGSRGMIGGQVEDLEATGSAGGDADRLAFIHRTKTGRLITASLLLGAMLAGADDLRLALVREYGDTLGLAFQIADDILDVTGTAESLGKSAGKDAAQGKLTYPGLYGLDEARRRLEKERGRAVELAARIEGTDGLLGSFAALVADRNS